MELLKIRVPQPVVEALQFRLSFKPFVDYLQKQKQRVPRQAGITSLYDHLIAKFTPFLSLLQPVEEVLITPPLEELLQLIKFSVLPLTDQEDEVPYAIGLPGHLITLFHYSEAFGQLMGQPEDFLPEAALPVIRQDALRSFYQLVLEKCYGVSTGTDFCPFFTFQTNAGNLTRYYRMRIDFRFLEPHLEKQLPPLQPAWLAFAKESRGVPPSGVPPSGTPPGGIVAELPVGLPLEQFTFHGVCLFFIEDITEETALRDLREVFVHLQTEPEGGIYQRFEKGLRDLCGQSDLEIGVTPFLQVNGNYVHHSTYTSRSIFLKYSGLHIDALSKSEVQQMITGLVSDPRPRVSPDLTGASEPAQQLLYGKGFRSLILYPIVVSNQALGMLEIGSVHPAALNGEVLQKVEQAIPMVTELLLYQINQFKARMEGIVHQKFTSLQPSVAWRFTEAAWVYLRQGGEKVSEDESTRVFFPGVYPFYGAIDVRNSSVERNRAIQRDLTRQLRWVGEILQTPGPPDKEEMTQELLTRNQYWESRLDRLWTPEDEVQVTAFLADEVHPCFQGLSEQPAVATRLQPYFNHTDATTGLFYQAYRAYQESLKQINDTVNDYLEQAEKQLRTLYPHYFEKFRTDGLEYNLYIGESIAPWLPFRPDHLRQLRGWQLASIVAMARLTHQLRSALPLPLQTTQLILAHSRPVDIQFRLDERRFDVEGAYSIRYEIIKKRIDKACVKGTQARLTQPDTLALAYTTSQEVNDYLPFINTLQERGELLPSIEFLELEPLQGVSGLKALRLNINYRPLPD
ncbi:MAG: hypothetical protein H7Z75_18470 [Ferruginibacter sp.]|nr:hypothetical protein [Cytophagales bacterium]